MAKQLKLAAQTRTLEGRNAVKKIKAQGLVPAVIYDLGRLSWWPSRLSREALSRENGVIPERKDG